MKISLSWLSEYLPIDQNPSDIAKKMTMAGVEVGKIVTIGDSWEDHLVIVGKILEISPHPNADRLRLPTIDIGKGEPITVVCGAPNIQVGQVIAFAHEGAQIFNPRNGKLEILKGAKIRGVESQGMVCSPLELGLGTNHDGILELNHEFKPGSPLFEVLGDTILETELTPNRPDCLSVLGTAYEVAALTGKKVSPPNLDYVTSSKPIENAVKVSIKNPDLCSRYTASVIEGVKIGPSQEWLRHRLEASGIRSINNVVDITNYVMLEYGQPLHAFDLDKLSGNEVMVRVAENEESLVTLDGESRTLRPEMLVIADQNEAIGLAGIMGGRNTEIDESTSKIFLESANFNGANTRSTRTALGLNTEASYRFERELRPELAELALRRATGLMIKLCGASASEGIIDEYPCKKDVIPIRLTTARITKILGAKFPMAEIWAILSSLGFQESTQSTDMSYLTEASEAPDSGDQTDVVWVIPPIWRSDISIEDDLIEEFARVYGYDNLPLRKPSSVSPNRIPDDGMEIKEILRDSLSTSGMNETVSYAVSNLKALEITNSIQPNSEAVKLANPMDATKAWLRTSLVANLLETLERNLRFNNQRTLRLFEIGHVFSFPVGATGDSLPAETEEMVGVAVGPRSEDSIWISSSDQIDFYDLKGILDFALDSIRLEVKYQKLDHPTYRSGHVAELVVGDKSIGEIGGLDDRVSDHFKLPRQAVFLFRLNLTEMTQLTTSDVPSFQPLSRYPSSSRDLALLCDEETTSDDIQQIIRNHRLVTNSFPIDNYVGGDVPIGFKSLTYRVVFRSMEMTLDTSELERAQQQIIRSLGHHRGIKERFPE